MMEPLDSLFHNLISTHRKTIFFLEIGDGYIITAKYTYVGFHINGTFSTFLFSLSLTSVDCLGT